MAREWVNVISRKVPEIFSVPLSQNGADSVFDASVNGSVTEQYWEFRPDAGEAVKVARMLVTIQDTGSFDSGGYGNIGALTNGLKVEKVRGSGVSATTVEDFTAIPITNNVMWGAYCYDINLSTFGLGDEFLNVRWTFAKAGESMWLFGDDNEALRVTIRDDLTGLNAHYFVIQGSRIGTEQ